MLSNPVVSAFIIESPSPTLLEPVTWDPHWVQATVDSKGLFPSHTLPSPSW